MTGEAWFKPKRYGYGFTPINWKGWLFLAVFIAALGGMGVTLLPQHRTIYFIGVALSVAVLIVVGIAKSEGEWRWRWGERT
jgi:uncharacterized membrane protein YhaH (DUF805 family)